MSWLKRHGPKVAVLALWWFLSGAWPHLGLIWAVVATLVLVVLVTRGRRKNRGASPEIPSVQDQSGELVPTFPAPVMDAAEDRFFRMLWAPGALPEALIAVGLGKPNQGMTNSIQQFSGGDFVDVLNGATLRKRVMDDSTQHLSGRQVWDVPYLVCAPEPSVTGPVLRFRLLPGQTLRLWEQVTDQLSTVWMVPSVSVSQSTDDKVRAVVEVRVVLHDLLAEPIEAAKFFRDNVSAPDGSYLPVAISDRAEPVSLGRSHFLVGGCAGSGKGSVAWAVAQAWAGPKAEGLTSLLAIDPKRSEFAGAEGFFDRVAHTPEEIAALLTDEVTEMRRRQEDPELGRTFRPSGRNRTRVLLIDEGGAISYGADRTTAKVIEDSLKVLLQQSRSAGYQIGCFVQEPDKATLPLRDLFQTRIALRMANDIQTELLCPGASTQIKPHELAVASESNNYATAGIGWVKSEDGTYTRCRFPKTEDEDITALVSLYKAGKSTDLVTNGENE